MSALHVWADTSWTNEICCAYCGLSTPSEYERAKREHPGEEGCTWDSESDLKQHLARRGLI